MQIKVEPFPGLWNHRAVFGSFYDYNYAIFQLLAYDFRLNYVIYKTNHFLIYCTEVSKKCRSYSESLPHCLFRNRSRDGSLATSFTNVENNFF